MAVYIVTGKLGSGKTLAMVGRIRDYLQEGRPVATNIDLDLPKLLGKVSTVPVYRVPDRPTVADLEAIGAVHSTGREELNGGLFLDEAGTWLNSRQWAGADRQGVIDWFLHSRKLGWDSFFGVQNISLLDKQVRDGLAEYVVHCRRMDRLRIPGIGRLIEAASFGLLSGRMPKVHLASVRYGMGPASMHADTWVYRGRDLYDAYQTTQIIRPGEDGGVFAVVDPRRWSEGTSGRPRSGRPHVPKLRIVQRLIDCLPPDERLAHWRRLESAGLLATR